MGSKNCKKVGREFQECDKIVSKRKRVAELIRWLKQDYIRYRKRLSYIELRERDDKIMA